jgi:pantothenate synthetase
MFNFKTAFFGLFVLLLLALPIGNYVVYSLYYVPVQKKSVEELEKYYPKIVADLKLIDQNPIFNKFTFEKNAEEVFEKNLSWTGLEPEQKHDLNHSNLHQFTEKYIRLMSAGWIIF